MRVYSNFLSARRPYVDFRDADWRVKRVWRGEDHAEGERWKKIDKFKYYALSYICIKILARMAGDTLVVPTF